MKFMVGQVTHHRLFDYRGVVVEAHPAFQLTIEWYDKVARTRPPKDKPWYHVLVHDSYQMADGDKRAVRNVIHASGSVDEANNELEHWFTKDELIDYAIRTGAPLEVAENLQDIEDEGDAYDSIIEIWPDYPTEDDYLWNEDEY